MTFQAVDGVSSEVLRYAEWLVGSSFRPAEQWERRQQAAWGCPAGVAVAVVWSRSDNRRAVGMVLGYRASTVISTVAPRRKHRVRVRSGCWNTRLPSVVAPRPRSQSWNAHRCLPGKIGWRVVCLGKSGCRSATVTSEPHPVRASALPSLR